MRRVGRRLLTWLVLLSVPLTMSCGKTLTPTNEVNVLSRSSIEDWSSYTLNVNGVNFTLPCTYSEFKETTGSHMDAVDEASILCKDSSTLCTVYRGKQSVAYIEIFNDSDEDLKYSECVIQEVSQDVYCVEQSGIQIKFPGDFYAGMSISHESLVKGFGEPERFSEYVDDNSDYWIKIYNWCENEKWSTINNFQIRVVKGVIDDISLNHTEILGIIGG